MFSRTWRRAVWVLIADRRFISRASDGEPALSPSSYARSRTDVSGESPSINPQGALVALTRSLVRGEMRDDEVVVVADVSG